MPSSKLNVNCNFLLEKDQVMLENGTIIHKQNISLFYQLFKSIDRTGSSQYHKKKDKVREMLMKPSSVFTPQVTEARRCLLSKPYLCFMDIIKLILKKEIVLKNHPVFKIIFDWIEGTPNIVEEKEALHQAKLNGDVYCKLFATNF